jgi:peptidoglycan/LPS O-acetylase OafA/YrhL
MATPWSRSTQAITIVVGLILLAWMSYHLIEQPAQEWMRRRFPPSQILPG